MTIHGAGRAVVALAALAPVAALVVAAGPANAITIVAKDSAPQVSLCHRTNSATNPYNLITVDANAVIRQGHDDHVGPVWNPTLKAAKVKWGDIIPAFDYTTNKGVHRHYAGMNTASLNIIAAGCVIAPKSVSVPAPVGADETCTTSGTITITAVTGVAWTIDGKAASSGVTNVAAGAHTVVATALPGYVLTGQSSFPITIAAKANCSPTEPQNDVVTPVAPTVAASTICEVEGTYTIPATHGVAYLSNGKAVAAGTYKGPATATITATAEAGHTLSTTTWSYALKLPAAAACPIDVEAPQAQTDEAVSAPTEETALAKTGASTTSLATVGALAVLAGTLLLAYGSRRPEEALR